MAQLRKLDVVHGNKIPLDSKIDMFNQILELLLKLPLDTAHRVIVDLAHDSDDNIRIPIDYETKMLDTVEYAEKGLLTQENDIKFFYKKINQKKLENIFTKKGSGTNHSEDAIFHFLDEHVSRIHKSGNLSHTQFIFPDHYDEKETTWKAEHTRDVQIMNRDVRDYLEILGCKTIILDAQAGNPVCSFFSSTTVTGESWTLLDTLVGQLDGATKLKPETLNTKGISHKKDNNSVNVKGLFGSSVHVFEIISGKPTIKAGRMISNNSAEFWQPIGTTFGGGISINAVCSFINSQLPARTKKFKLPRTKKDGSEVNVDSIIEVNPIYNTNHGVVKGKMPLHETHLIKTVTDYAQIYYASYLHIVYDVKTVFVTNDRFALYVAWIFKLPFVLFSRPTEDDLLYSFDGSIGLDNDQEKKKKAGVIITNVLYYRYFTSHFANNKESLTAITNNLLKILSTTFSIPEYIFIPKYIDEITRKYNQREGFIEQILKIFPFERLFNGWTSIVPQNNFETDIIKALVVITSQTPKKDEAYKYINKDTSYNHICASVISWLNNNDYNNNIFKSTSSSLHFGYANLAKLSTFSCDPNGIVNEYDLAAQKIMEIYDKELKNNCISSITRIKDNYSYLDETNQETNILDKEHVFSLVLARQYYLSHFYRRKFDASIIKDEFHNSNYSGQLRISGYYYLFFEILFAAAKSMIGNALKKNIIITNEDKLEFMELLPIKFLNDYTNNNILSPEITVLYNEFTEVLYNEFTEVLHNEFTKVVNRLSENAEFAKVEIYMRKFIDDNSLQKNGPPNFYWRKELAGKRVPHVVEADSIIAEADKEHPLTNDETIFTNSLLFLCVKAMKNKEKNQKLEKIIVILNHYVKTLTNKKNS